jgi:hypothetical protein
VLRCRISGREYQREREIESEREGERRESVCEEEGEWERMSVRDERGVHSFNSCMCSNKGKQQQQDEQHGNL